MTSALTQELERETVQSAAIVNRLRLIGVSAFFTLTIVLRTYPSRPDDFQVMIAQAKCNIAT